MKILTVSIYRSLFRENIEIFNKKQFTYVNRYFLHNYFQSKSTFNFEKNYLAFETLM